MRSPLVHILVEQYQKNKMNRFIQTAWLAFMPWFCFGQFSGIVVDSDTKEKVQGAIVTIENSFLNAVTDADGKFSFDKTKEQSVKVNVTHLGYQTVVQEIQMPNEQLVIALIRKTYMTEETTVTSTRASDNSPTAFTNVTKKEIEEKNLGQDIPFLLTNTPSVVVTSDAGNGVGYTGIRIRGSDATRVNVTINGIPVNDAESHQVYWVDLPDFASSIENIQIQRGIGTSTNGAGAFGGSVNIQSSALSVEPFAKMNSSYGSFNTWKNTVNFGTGLLKNKFAFEGRLSKITSDGYIDRATSDLKSFYFSGGYYETKSSLKGIIFSGKEKTYQAWYGVPEDSLKTNRTYNPAGEYTDAYGNLQYYPNQTDNYQQDYYQLLYSYAANSSLNLNAALHYTKGKGYYEEYVSKYAAYGEGTLSFYGLNPVVIDTVTIDSSDVIRQKWLDNDFYGYTFAANYDKNDLQLTLGGAGNRYKGRHYDQLTWGQYFSNGTYPYVYDDNDATKDDINFFAKASYAFTSQLSLFGDMQYRTVQYSFLGFNNDSTNAQQKVSLNFFNPKGGITYSVNSKNKIYASVAVGHKEPMRDDYVDSPPYAYPKPEQMTDVEAGYKYSGDKIRFGLNLYSMNYKNQLILTGKINDVGAYTRINVPDSYRRGMEAEFSWNIIKNISLSTNITLSENKIKTFDEYIDNWDDGSQQLVVHNNSDISFSPSGISSSVISFTPAKNFIIEITNRYIGKQYLDNTSDENRKLDAYNLDDFFISYHVSTASIKEIELKLAVYNFFDKKYESNGWTYPYISNAALINSNAFYPQAGINLMAGISLKF
jgi:iron complex outermembrane receptor protein